MTVAAASLRTRDVPFFAGPCASSYTAEGAAAGGAVILWALWPILALGALAVPPFLLLAIAFACGFLLLALQNRLRGKATGDFLSTPPDCAGLLGLVGSQLFWLLGLRLAFPPDATPAAPWPVLGAAFAGLVGQLPPGAAAGAALGSLLAGCALCWAAFATARRHRAAGAPDVLGGLCGIAAPICLVLHLCLEPRLPLDPANLLAAAAIGLGPLGIAGALWDRAARGGEMRRLSAARRRGAGGR